MRVGRGLGLRLLRRGGCGEVVWGGSCIHGLWWWGGIDGELDGIWEYTYLLIFAVFHIYLIVYVSWDVGITRRLHNRGLVFAGEGYNWHEYGIYLPSRKLAANTSKKTQRKNRKVRYSFESWVIISFLSRISPIPSIYTVHHRIIPPSSSPRPYAHQYTEICTPSPIKSRSVPSILIIEFVKAISSIRYMS